ncbi:hypothetical protein ACOME3_002637 [Neoechinorhynchus agilis]
MNTMNHYSVSKVYTYWGYSHCCSRDIALIKLRENLLRSKKINTICLPDSNLRFLENKNAVIAGWGISTETRKWYSSNSVTLHHGYVLILDERTCSNSYSYYDPHDELCALNPLTKTDTRPGDSGGPLMILENDRWILVGVASHGNPYNSSFPGFYSKINGKLDFIEKYIN